jgi:ectoine hydroxylase-related dioxygenase (phytanoyl-CoA dioxygenase family)
MSMSFVNDGFALGGSVFNQDISDELFNLICEEAAKAIENCPEEYIYNGKHFDIPITKATLYADYPFAKRLAVVARRFASSLIGNKAELIQAQLVSRKKDAECVPFHVDGNRTVNSFAEMPFCKVIVGIPLTSLMKPKSGNLIYLPGMHHMVREFIRRNFERFIGMEKIVAFREVYAYAKELTSPQNTVFCEKGDIYGMHSLLPHAVDENQNEDRTVWYFRFGETKTKGNFDSAFPPEDWPIMSD